ncbi:Uncharacterized membrane protein YhaH, DUF805 family [Brevibacterium siliguriense]|uniref:Uncharacterized membrane protein YhaH, DUF805 family n=1 Tax=Brevibacterium siliguriense TaxID=1136497 RepID=A0A1H1P1P2_9MICO|nr:DUF805 domain-containing protein [Brevibacterium siliguriense]SDS04940.1 Uncharacterized membrane protein YhaH, DUF805 family [Brevibacterium siliguriense]
MSYDANAAYNSGAPGQGAPGAAGQGYGGQGFGGAPRGAASPDDLSLPLYGASFGQAVKRFFKNYAKFSGRASRSEFWFAYLFLVLIALLPYILFIIGAVMMAASASADPYGGGAPSGGGVALMGIGGVLLGVIFLATLVPSIAVSWRRLHDAGFSGLFYLLNLTSIGAIVVLVMEIMPPKPEGQRFDV